MHATHTVHAVPDLCSLQDDSLLEEWSLVTAFLRGALPHSRPVAGKSSSREDPIVSIRFQAPSLTRNADLYGRVLECGRLHLKRSACQDYAGRS